MQLKDPSLDELNSSSPKTEISKLLPEVKTLINKDETCKLSQLSKRQEKSPALRNTDSYTCNFPTYTKNKPSQ
jgi:hypothetical protein